MTVPGVVPQLSRTPGSIRRAARWTVGADTDAVLGAIGIDDERLAELRDAGVV
jgi:formyl-CoA transferase